ncbi:MAG: hypothetical protein M3R47_00455 [Chloroflexota bacterium]|nr:hypothetical protein [Chloroflexota bacterium]
MNKIKPFEKIAAQFQISQESAKYFLNHVQKSFKTEKPSHTLILQFIESQNIDVLLTPFEVAALMNESGAWKFALVTAPPVIENDEDDLSDWDD